MNDSRRYEFQDTDGLDADEAIWFSGKSRERILKIDRIIDWGFTAAIIGFGIWVVFW